MASLLKYSFGQIIVSTAKYWWNFDQCLSRDKVQISSCQSLLFKNVLGEDKTKHSYNLKAISRNKLCQGTLEMHHHLQDLLLHLERSLFGLACVLVSLIYDLLISVYIYV